MALGRGARWLAMTDEERALRRSQVTSTTENPAAVALTARIIREHKRRQELEEAS